jgi:PadR family transcriptional regulator PadR
MWSSHMGRQMANSKLHLLPGTLELMVLQTLSAKGSQHGYGIARLIERLSGDEILLNQGTMYAALVRLHRRGWISAEWGASENNHKAKFYSITKRGANQLAGDGAYWQRLVRVIGRVLAEPQEDKTSPNPASRSLIGLTPLSKNVPRFLASHECIDREPALPKERR